MPEITYRHQYKQKKAPDSRVTLETEGKKIEKEKSDKNLHC